MKATDFWEILLTVCSIAVIVVVGRSNVKKHLITDLQALALSHEQTINQLKAELRKKDERICALEETVDGYTELVRQGYLLGSVGQGSRNRSAPSKTTKNRTP